MYSDIVDCRLHGDNCDDIGRRRFGSDRSASATAGHQVYSEAHSFLPIVIKLHDVF